MPAQISEPDDFDETALFTPPTVSPTPPRPAPHIHGHMTGGHMAGHTVSPLAQYYRIPGVHVHLPSNGAFMPPGAIQFSMNGDIPVYPMRAADELLLKSPDALMSGYAIEKLLESCVPSIRAPRLVSTADLDVLLLAIRAATSGETMPITARCPKCAADISFDCHLPALLQTMTFNDPENMIRLNDEVVVYLRPYNLHNATKLALATFQETRRLQALDSEAQEDAHNAQMNRSLSRLSKLSLEVTADCIVKVVIPGSTVTNRLEVLEFVDNVSKTWIEKIEAALKEINTRGVDKKLHVTCTECQHEWTTEVEFNAANFFIGGSSN